MSATFDSAIKTIEKLRAMGAVSVSFHVGGDLAQATFASPELPIPTEDKPESTHQRLLKAEREELAKLKERYEMDEELGNA